MESTLDEELESLARSLECNPDSPVLASVRQVQAMRADVRGAHALARARFPMDNQLYVDSVTELVRLLIAGRDAQAECVQWHVDAVREWKKANETLKKQVDEFERQLRFVPSLNIDGEHLSCMICNKGGEENEPAPEWIVIVRPASGGVVLGKGLHRACWDKHARSTSAMAERHDRELALNVLDDLHKQANENTTLVDLERAAIHTELDHYSDRIDLVTVVRPGFTKFVTEESVRGLDRELTALIEKLVPYDKAEGVADALALVRQWWAKEATG